MIILMQKGGQTCNQLFYFGHFIAYAIENNISLYNAAFYENKQYFSATAVNDFGPYHIKVLSKWSYLFLNMIRPLLMIAKRSPVHRFIRIREGQGYNIEDLPESKIIIPYGWLFRAHGLFARHSNILRSFFTPVEPYKSNVLNIMARCRKDVDILVGVHIRKGDYNEWEGGKYFYSDSDYLNIMKHIESQLDGRVGFLLCSNERINLENFMDLKCFSGGKHFIEDLYSLAECDYIIGPPSTFSLWASFYGDKPHFHIRDMNSVININDFKSCQG